MDVHEHLGALRRGLDAVVPEGLSPSDAGLLLVVGGVLGLMVGLLVAFFSKAFINRVPRPDETVAGEQPVSITRLRDSFEGWFPAFMSGGRPS